MIRDLFGAVGRWWVRVQDATEAQRNAERYGRAHLHLLRQWNAEHRRAERLAADLAAERQKYTDLRTASGVETTRVADVLATLRGTVAHQADQIRDLSRERDAAVRDWRLADRALEKAQIPPGPDPYRKESEEHRKNALWLTDELDELRKAKEIIEAEAHALELHVAELVARLDKCGREHS